MTTAYKKDDKIVLSLLGIDVYSLNRNFEISIKNEQILGKLEDFQPAEEKIEMTVEEKEEFDKLKVDCTTLRFVLSEIFENNGNLYEHLKRKIMLIDNDKSNKAQIEFAKAWETPSRIEVVEPEKHTVSIAKMSMRRYLYRYENTGTWSFTETFINEYTLDEVKEAEKQLGIQGLQAKWHKAAEEGTK